MVAHADLPGDIQRRTNPKDFTGRPPALPTLDDWLRANPRYDRQTPLTMVTARRVLGLPDA